MSDLLHVEATDRFHVKAYSRPLQVRKSGLSVHLNDTLLSASP